MLRREVRDAIPAGLLTAAERLLVLEIADDANDVTRIGYPGAEKLAHLTDLAERSIQETLNRIGKKWIEVRVEIGRDKKDRPVYAHKGHRTDFKFPADLAAAFEQARVRRASLLALEAAMDPGAFDGATNPGPLTGEAAMDPEQRRDESVESRDGSVPEVRQIRGPSPQFPQDTSDLSSGAAGPGVEEQEREQNALNSNPNSQVQVPSAAYGELRRFGVTDQAEADALIPLITKAQPKGVGWWRTLGNNGDLGALVAEARRSLANPPTVPGKVQDQAQLAYLEAVGSAPLCPHDEPGGHIPRPGIGTPRCPQCRRAQAPAAPPRQEFAAVAAQLAARMGMPDLLAGDNVADQEPVGAGEVNPW